LSVASVESPIRRNESKLASIHQHQHGGFFGLLCHIRQISWFPLEMSAIHRQQDRRANARTITAGMTNQATTVFRQSFLTILAAHVGYWENEALIRETAQLFYDYGI
jgi:hypothetical protein